MSETVAEGSGPARPEIDVSFVVTIFNKAPFITGMVESLRRQTDGLKTEFIFVDDGSTDGSIGRVECDTRDLPNVTIIRQPNSGPAIATNIGVGRARGRYVKLVDADDRLSTGITPVLWRELERRDADLIVGKLGTYRLDAVPGSERTLNLRVTALDDPLQTVIATGLSNTSGTLFRRLHFIEAGGCDETVFVQDFSFFLRMAKRGRFLTTDAVVAYVPEVARGRVSELAGQTLHDSIRVLFNFFSVNTSFPSRYRRLAMRRAAGRAWKWALRHRGATLISKAFLVHAVSRLPFADLAPWVLRHACRTFYVDPNLRFPGSRV